MDTPKDVMAETMKRAAERLLAEIMRKAAETVAKKQSR
jgi:hypothetical protein